MRIDGQKSTIHKKLWLYSEYFEILCCFIEIEFWRRVSRSRNTWSIDSFKKLKLMSKCSYNAHTRRFWLHSSCYVCDTADHNCFISNFVYGLLKSFLLFIDRNRNPYFVTNFKPIPSFSFIKAKINFFFGHACLIIYFIFILFYLIGQMLDALLLELTAFS